MRGRVLAVILTIVALAALVAACGSKSSAATTPSPSASKTLIVWGAGTLAGAWTQEIAAFKAQNPGVTVHSQFASSGDLVKQITQLHSPDDVLGSADYTLIPSLMFPKYATWYIGFVTNYITFAYTSHSKGAAQLTSSNWYKILAEPGVRIGRSTPAADPSGYYILAMLKLAQSYYHDPNIYASVLKNSPSGATAEEETALNGALQSGQIDYLAIYKSDALQYGFKYIHLPAQINLSDPSLAKHYATVTVPGVERNDNGQADLLRPDDPDDLSQSLLGREVRGIRDRPAGPGDHGQVRLHRDQSGARQLGGPSLAVESHEALAQVRG